MDKVFKWIAIGFIGAIIVALASLLLFIQTDYARRWGTEKGLSYAHIYINSTISVGEVKGNLFNYIDVNDVVMVLDSQRIVTIPRIQIYYSPLRLLRKEVYVDSVIIDKVWVKAETYADSTWNFAHLYKPSNIKSIADSTTSNFKVNINHVVLQNAIVETITPYSIIPKQIDSLRIEGDFRWRSGKWGVYLNQLSLKASKPVVTVSTLRFILESEKDTLSLKNFALKTPRNFIETDAFYSNIISYGANLWADSIDANEIEFLLPNIALPQFPDITFDVNSNNQRIIIHAKARMNKEQIEASVLIGQKQPSPSETLVNEASVVFKNTVLNHWGVPVDSTILLSGRVDVRTRALTSLTDTIFYKAVLDSSVYSSYKINHLAADGYLVNKTTRFKGNINSSQLVASAKGVVYNIGTTNNIDLSGTVTNFNLIKLEPKAQFATNLNGHFNAVGSFPANNPMSVSSVIVLTKSTFDRMEFDSAFVKSVLVNDRITIDSINIQLPLLSVAGSGFATYKGAYGASLQAIGSIEHMAQAYSTAELPAGNLVAQVQLEGVLDSLGGSFNAKIDSFQLDSISFSTISAKSNFRYNKELAVDSMQFLAKQFSGYGILIDTITVAGSYLNDEVGATIFAETNKFGSISFNSQTSIKSPITSKIQDFRVTTNYAKWYNKSNQIDLSLSKTNLSIKGFNIADELNDSFCLEANGNLSMVGGQDFLLHIANLDLAHLYTAQVLSNAKLKGVTNLDIGIKGTASNPLVQASAQIDSFYYDSFKLHRIQATLTSTNKEAKLDLTAVSTFQDSVHLMAMSPLKFTLDTTTMHFNFPGLVSGRVWSSTINLQNLSTMGRNVVTVNGNLTFDINFKGHYNALVYKGMALLENGLIVDKKVGVDYSNIYGKMVVDSNTITLDTLSLSDGKGTFLASGWANFDTLHLGGSISKSNLDIKARNFGVLRSSKSEVVVDADFKLSSEKEFPTFDGNIRVLKSSFFVPAFMQTDYVTEANKMPLLVQAQTKNHKLFTDTAVVTIKRDTTASLLFTNLMENLTGSIKVDIPKNTWLKSETSKIELNGQLFVVKKNPYFELLGKIEVTRGQLVVYERKFTITSGVLEFQGGRKINPMLDITTEYSFRSTNNVTKILKLKITGYMEAPIISYTLDGNTISAADAYAYILFGVPLNEISGSSSESLDITSSLSSEMVSKIISNQLTQTLGDAFSLDIIEVNAQNNMQNVAFTVGKYITKDLFVTYQKGFGDASSTEATTDQLILEYELTKNVFFRLQSGDSKTSGVDLILKFER